MTASEISFLDTAAARRLDPYFQDVYDHWAYGWSAELIDGGDWECALDQSSGVSFSYIKRAIPGQPTEFDIVTPYGYGGISGPSDASAETKTRFRDQFLIRIRERGAVAAFLRLNPLRDDPWTRLAGSSASLRTTQACDVQTPYEAVAASSGAHRTAVRKAQRAGVRVRSVPPLELSDQTAPFRRLYDETMDRVDSRRGLRVGDDYFKRLLGLPAGVVHVFQADRDDVPVASAIFLRWGNHVHYHLSSSSSEGRFVQATNAIIDHAIHSFSCPFRLHLGGGLTEGDHLERFKRRIAPTSLEMHNVRYVVRADRYKELCAHLEPTDYFPAYRATTT